MRPALVLIDLQNDFLAAEGLTPPRGVVVGAVARLLADWRSRGLPVVHVWTTVDDPRSAMPHWVAADRYLCLRDTPGHATPQLLAPRSGEAVIHKTYFSAFSSDAFAACLKAHSIDTLVLVGVHMHGCVRATAIDAYQHGCRVLLADDAIACYDPLHAEQTRVYLDGRAARCCDSAEILAMVDGGAVCEAQPAPDDLTAAAQRARRAVGEAHDWPAAQRVAWMARVAACLESRADALARQIAVDVGKPIVEAEGEVRFAVDLVRSAARYFAQPLTDAPRAGLEVRRVPVGVVAVITPWNNPLAIALGKIVPAVAYGNAVLWKPAPQGDAIAQTVMNLLAEADTPTGAVQLVSGGARTGGALMYNATVDAVTITGSLKAGRAAQLVCAKRMILLQAELGGNNAAIVWHDADLPDAAAAIARGAFGFAGQRCTATRRVIVPDGLVDDMVEQLRIAATSLPIGDPLDRRTVIGPVIDESNRQRIERAIEQAASEGARVLRIGDERETHRGCHVAPAIVVCDDPRLEIVQCETFGPVLVVQPATDWHHAIELCNGVAQGLAASLFSDDDALWHAFARAAEVGIIKRNLATAGADADAPFGGWKASAIGPAEHAQADRQFYTRPMTVYT